MNLKTAPLFETLGTTIFGTNGEICKLDKAEVIDKFNSSSLLLFRGFDVDTDKFKAFTELFSTNFVSYVGGAYSREMINGDKTLLSVTGGKLHFPVPLHGEMYYRKQKPDILWFYCASPPLKDGETTVCDGIQIYNELSSSTQKLFQEKRLKYIRTYPEDVWQKIYQTDDLSHVEAVCRDNDMQLEVNRDHSITTNYIASAIQLSRGKCNVFINNILPVVAQEVNGSNTSLVRFEDNSKIPDVVINEIKTVTERIIHLVSWQTGDILMIDNTRLLHGRRAFADNQRDIYVRLCEANFSFRF
jgi:alpha-ketoglutarate-dependent taurine dioxygenase